MTQTQETENLQVTDQDLELASRIIIEWHKQKKLAFAIVNSGAGLMLSSGNAFELEGALNHAHKILEQENAMRLIEIRQRHLIAQEAANKKHEE